ncbi:MAG TPA: alpha/beta hydrolase [Vicinamibacterales bacterium]|nr:alpha/beta hydrolase [Vicinamibacterales bacterium]
MLDAGSGPVLLVIPGIHGRWEWMRPSIEALAREFRVIAVSLPGEPGVHMPFDEGTNFDSFVGYIDSVLDAAGVPDAVICGVSFGGLIALRYAARRSHRVRGLILVSTPGPRWKLKPHYARYARWPTLSTPLFALGAIRRYWRELREIYPSLHAQLNVSASTSWRVVNAPAMPYRMSHRTRLAENQNFEADCACVTAPTLVVTGERELDQVVPCEDTMRYVTLIPGARFQLFERTGHLGTVLAPERFAAIVSRFLND